MVSVDLSAQVQTGCVVTKGTKLCLESVGLSVLLKMNAVQFTLDGFEILFFSTISTFGRSSNMYSIYLICYILLLWKPNKPDIFMKLTVLGSYLFYYKG